jgi:hypothetical protein
MSILVIVAEQLAEQIRNDLPRNAELIAKPSALQLFAALRERFPKGIDFFLRLPFHEQRNRHRTQ